MAFGGVGVKYGWSRVDGPQLGPFLVNRTAERQQGPTPLAGFAILGIEHLFCQCLKRFQRPTCPVC